MIEYVVKFYNNKSNNPLFEEEMNNVDIEKLLTSEKELDFVVIERRKKTPNETITAQSMVFFNKNKWKYKKMMINQKTIKRFESNGSYIDIDNNCRTKHCNNKEDILNKIEKIRNSFYFIDENSMTYEEFYRKKHHK